MSTGTIPIIVAPKKGKNGKKQFLANKLKHKQKQITKRREENKRNNANRRKNASTKRSN